MGYALMWAESLAAALVLLAAIAAIRWPYRWLQYAVIRVVTIIMLSGMILVTMFLGAFFEHLFLYSLFWTVAFCIGGILFERRWAATWSATRLAIWFGIFVALFGVTLSSMDMAMRIQLASVEARAGAMALAVAPPRVPDRENAAHVYQMAFDVLTPLDRLPLEKWNIWGDLEKNQVDVKDEDLKKYLDSQAAALSLLRKAAAIRGCYFEHDYPSIDMGFPEWEKFRDGVRLLSLDARYRAAQGDAQASLDDIAAIFGIASHVSEQSILRSLLAAAAWDGVGVRTLEHVLTLVDPGKLEERFTGWRPSYRRRLERSLRMEEAIGLSFMATSSWGATPTIVDDMTRSIVADQTRFVDNMGPFWRVIFLPDDLAAYQHLMAESRRLTALPYPTAVVQRTNLEDFRLHQGAILTRIMAPAVEKCQDAAARADALHRLARLALACKAYRAKHHSYPQKLGDLVPEYLPEIPRDPFDEQPLRMVAKPDGLVLYSIGLDLKDDGGVPWDNATRQGDLIFRLTDGKKPGALERSPSGP